MGRLRKIKILAIDDEAEIREVLKETFATVPEFELLLAGDGQEGFGIIKQEKIDVLLTDLVLPKMNGFELLRKLRIQGLHIPTIVLTGHADRQIAEQLRAYGVQHYLAKPWRNQQLIELILNLANKSEHGNHVA